MSGLARLIVFFSIFAAISLISNAQYVLPITKQEPSKQYYTTLDIGSAAKSPVNLLLDLGTNLPWLNCRNLKSLSSLRLVTCWSSTCKSIPGNGCDGKHCLYSQPNPVGKPPVTTGRVVQDKATLFTTDGGRKLPKVSLPRLTFSCADKKYLQGFSSPIAGVLALSPGRFSFWSQVTRAFNIIPQFAICLPSSGTGQLHMGFVNDSMIPPFGGFNHPIPKTLTPLYIESGNYLLSFTSIYVDGIPLPLKPSLFNSKAKFSTVVPYTVLQTHIYNALATAFTRKAKKIGLYKTPGPAPFKHCYAKGGSRKNIEEFVNMLGIELGVPGRIMEMRWSFHGANTVVKVSETVVCLAFVDGGKKPNEPMVIGTHQLQNYMIVFDLSTTLMTFSDSLLAHNTSCSTWPSQK